MERRPGIRVRFELPVAGGKAADRIQAGFPTALPERRPARLPVVGYRMQKQALQTRDMRPMVGGPSTASSERGTTVEGSG